MPILTKTVDKGLVKGNEIFIYTFNISFSDLIQQTASAYLIDIFPNNIKYSLPQIGGPIVNITTTPVESGTEVKFDFGNVSSGTSISFTVACSFGPSRKDGDVFQNTANLYIDSALYSIASATPVIVTLEEAFSIVKSSNSYDVKEGEEVTFSIVISNKGDAGACAKNLVITDVLPQELKPVTTFLPVGNDRQTSGYSDPTYNGRTGSWTGQVLNFDLPSYCGANYQIKYKAIVAKKLNAGDKITNIAKLSVDGQIRKDSTATLTVIEDGLSLNKFGTPTAIAGGPISFALNISNQTGKEVTNVALKDSIPEEMILKTIKFTKSSIFESYSIFVKTRNNSQKEIPIIENTTEDLPITEVTTFIPEGEEIGEVILTSPKMLKNSKIGEFSLRGTVKENTDVEFIKNTATLNGNRYPKVKGEYVVSLNGASDLFLKKQINPPLDAYTPLDEFEVVLSSVQLNTMTVNPIFCDLMPNEMIYINNSEYFEYFDSTTETKYDSRLPNFPLPLPTREIIDDFGGTGKTLLRWKFEDVIIPQGGYLSVIFKGFIKIAASNVFENKAYLGIEGDNLYHAYNNINDDLDYDGDGVYYENLSGATINGVVLTKSEFLSKKKVKGNLDLDYNICGCSEQGGFADYQIQITNNQNYDLKDIELIDIFPYIGDTGVILNNTLRGSQFSVYPLTTVTAKIIDVRGNPITPSLPAKVEYSTSIDPIRFNLSGVQIGTGTWSTTPPDNIIDIRSIRVTTDSNVILKPYYRLIVDFRVKVPNNVELENIAYNSFAIRANKISEGGVVTPMLPTEPNKVALTIVEPKNSSIGEFVWIDVNENGIYDENKIGINGVKVELLNKTHQLLCVTYTSNDAKGKAGYYLFTNLPSGEYYIRFTLPENYDFTIQNLDKNGSRPNQETGITPIIVLPDNTCDLTQNAGLIIKRTLTGCIGSFVWFDKNGNGSYQPNEEKINGVTVELYNSNMQYLQNTVTADKDGEKGYYEFCNLLAGDYYVKFIAPQGYNLTKQVLNQPNGSRPNPDTGFTPLITLKEGEIKTDINAGLIDKPILTGCIGSFVWIDTNTDGIYQQSEKKINGIKIELYDRSMKLLKTTITASKNGKPGYYEFCNLTEGSYYLRFIAPRGYTLTKQVLNRPNGSKPNPTTTLTPIIYLSAGEEKIDQNAGLIATCPTPTVNVINFCISVYEPCTLCCPCVPCNQSAPMEFTSINFEGIIQQKNL